ncbi:MAG TPA: hypothetical protein VJN21_15075 [Candidatus Acidoferrales bacterium]|nr:hypothetical protein [Candidatus Acidoferrales bacterium]
MQQQGRVLAEKIDLLSQKPIGFPYGNTKREKELWDTDELRGRRTKHSVNIIVK